MWLLRWLLNKKKNRTHLTPRNASVKYWSKTRGRGIVELQIDMWWRKRRGHHQSIWACMFIFLPKSSDFAFTRYLSSPHTHSLSAGVQWSHEKQFHGRWPESPQNLQPYDTELSCRSAARALRHTKRVDAHTYWATALVVAFHVAPDDISANTHSGQVILIMLR